MESEEESDSGIASLAAAYVAKSIFNTEDNAVITDTDANDKDYSTTTYCFMARGAKGTTPASSEWIIDSGCTNHMTGKRSLLWTQPYVHPIRATSHLLTLVKVRYWV